MVVASSETGTTESLGSPVLSSTTVRLFLVALGSGMSSGGVVVVGDDARFNQPGLSYDMLAEKQVCKD